MAGPSIETPEIWSSRRWACWVSLPLLAIVFAMVLQMRSTASGIADLNRTLFLWVNQAATHWTATGWSTLTNLGDASTLLALLSPLLLVRPQALAALLAAVPLGGLLSVLLKRTFDAPRPVAVLDAAQFHVIGPLLSHHSFPSGHTISAFAAAVAFLAVMQSSRRNPAPSAIRFAALCGLAFGLALAVGISRVAVGAHWPVDVLAGAACGWLAGLSGAAATRRWPLLWQAAAGQWALLAISLGIAAWLLWRPVDYPMGAPVVWLSVASVAMTAIAMCVRAKRV